MTLVTMQAAGDVPAAEDENHHATHSKIAYVVTLRWRLGS
jgi:hypothetical protein